MKTKWYNRDLSWLSFNGRILKKSVNKHVPLSEQIQDMRKVLQVVCISLFALPVLAQDTVINRIIFIGDAGEINFKQETIIPLAADLILADKTTVLFLGDNIYPRGMGLAGSAEEPETAAILRSQFSPMRAKGAPVYFLPGNHDWDKSGQHGLAKIRAQGDFLAAQNDSLLRLIPANGCPDPIEVPLSDEMVIIAYDSEWWLFPYAKGNPNVDCDCNTEAEVIERLEELFYKNQDKTILLVSHHPFETYGVHGGHYSVKDHLFPFTLLNKSLYIPMPVIGSLYPLLRTTVFLNPEDLPHPQYRYLKRQVSDVFEGYSNLIYVAGHEHGLQFIKNKDQYQIVSGSGSKSSFIKNNKRLLYKNSMQGFVTVDMMNDRSTQITYYTYADQGIKADFVYRIPYKEEVVTAPHQVPIDADSLVVQANPKYNDVSTFHRRLFGENYRAEWAAPTKLPVIRLSEFSGGLKPIKRGGGMQTISLRLEDPTGKQWVLRSVNKTAEALLPSALHYTFAEDFIDDAVSAQHPYSALMVPPIANAAQVPHTNPIIGVVAPDTALGIHNLAMAGTLALLEEREPLGDSDNTPKMLAKIYNDNDDTFGAHTFFRSRLLDLLIGDWDRHGDQYRWVDDRPGKDKDYRVVPRDRDQVLRVMEGVFPYLASRSWAVPTIQGFGAKINSTKYSLFKSDFLNAQPEMQFSLKQWNTLTKEFVENVTDSVLDESINRLPSSSYDTRHAELLSELKERRDAIPSEMEEHYRFINSIVDIRLSDKNEWVSIEDAADHAVRIWVRKINKDGEPTRSLMDKTYDPEITKEIRVYLSGGQDSVDINTAASPIKIRVIGGNGQKDYHIQEAANKIKLYDLGNSTASGKVEKLQTHLSADSATVAYVPVNLYNVFMPLATAGYNADDGLLLGAGFKYTHQRGFRKTPYTHTQQLMVSGSFATGSFKINYQGRWREAVGNADFIIDGEILAPNNTQNFFGLGNNSTFDDNRSMRYYRTRFNLYELKPALQWSKPKSTFKIGPALQYYSFDPSKNSGRFIENTGQLNSYDSLTIHENKLFAGFITELVRDNRNNTLLPTSGGYFNLQVKAYTGLNDYSKSFAQLTSEFSVYKSFVNDAVVLANRIGGGTTLGKTTFYQALFLGGQGNLLGLRKYRYAGEHMLYNNLETRIKLADIGSYILPGQLGLIGFYDIGKTWTKGYNSKDIHQGVGGGIYYAPAQMLVVQAIAGHAEERWFPYFSLGFRF